MRPVIGIDPSLTATGVCWANGYTDVIKWPDTGTPRLIHVYGRMADIAENTSPGTLFVLEGLSYGSKGSAITGQAELGAVMRLALAHVHAQCLVIPPSCVKKYATGKGNANKDLVRDNARDRLGLPMGVTSDEADAAWLRQIGMRLVGDPAVVDVPKLHLSALDKVPALEAA